MESGHSDMLKYRCETARSRVEGTGTAAWGVGRGSIREGEAP